jgi:DNA primase
LIAANVKRVVVIPDGDEPGQRHAEAVARSCAGAGPTVKIVPLPGGAQDVSAWLDAGGTKDTLTTLIKAAAVYTPTAQDTAFADVADVPVITTVSNVKRESVRLDLVAAICVWQTAHPWWRAR